MASSSNHFLAAMLVLLVALVPADPARAQDGRGGQLFELCAQCHGPDGGGDPAALAPSIAGMHAWYLKRQLQKFRSGVRGMHPGDTAGLRMYPMSLSLRDEADLEAVADYVAALPAVEPAPLLTGGNPERGKLLYAPCAACHGPEARGNEQLGGPSLHGSDWYQLTQLQNFKSGVRGSNPKDVQGALMRPMASTLVDEQAMKDVIAYIHTLGN